MIAPYKLHRHGYQMLHCFMMSFLKKMAEMVEQGKPFQEKVFHPDFLPIALAHKTKIYKRCERIYQAYAAMNEHDRKVLADRVSKSMDVEAVCKGNVMPVHKKEVPQPLFELVKKTFEDLYKDILRGREASAFVKNYGHIRKHFEEFFTKNNSSTLCPFCGVSPVNTEEMMEYDHYLPKSIYPLYAVNLKNLVPTCKVCNQTYKKAKDVIKGASGRIFYPFDQTLTGVDIVFHMSHPVLELCQWTVDLKSREGLSQELESWKWIYGIEKRYVSQAKDNSSKVWGIFMETVHYARLENPELTLDQIKSVFQITIRAMQHSDYNMLLKPTFDALCQESHLLQALRESQEYTKV